MLKLYVCGPTVYDSPHIGNLRPLLTYDLFVRALAHLDKPYFYVHNITDIDDKIIDRAAKLKISEVALATRYFNEYLALMKTYHIKRPTRLPLVTQNLPAIISVIRSLLKLKAAYLTPEGVYFDVTQAKTYGEVSHQDLASMQFEVEANSFKRHPADFALWKFTTRGLQFNSPWGSGRPGWHTECVALINKYFKHQALDIHGGGIDLRFPHHENENAQFYALHQKSITKAWMHVGQIYWSDLKMSKSLGNVVLAQDFATKYGADTLRLIIFNAALTSPIYLSAAQISQAQSLVDKWTHAFNRAQLVLAEHVLPAHSALSLEIARFIAQLDLTNARLLVQEAVKDFNSQLTIEAAKSVILSLKLLGFNFSQKRLSKRDQLLYNQWVDLKRNMKFEQADVLREKLQARKLL